MNTQIWNHTQLRWHQLNCQGLVCPLATPEAVASQLIGVQAQIVPAAGLALWNRLPAFTAAELAERLYVQRSLVKLWGQRHTLHLYPREDWALLYAAQADLKSYWEREARKTGANLTELEALVSTVEALLRERDDLGRSDLRATELALDETHLSGWGGIFSILARRGRACHAQPQAGEARMAHRTRWLPEMAWEPPDLEEANLTLMKRYFGTYGPATLQDFAYWRGRTLTEVRRWAVLLADELVHVQVEEQTMLALRTALPELDPVPPDAEAWPVKLLGRFDPLLLSIKDKSQLIAPEHYQRVWRPAGHIEATVLVAGHLVGTWRYERRQGGLVLTIEPFQPLSARIRQSVEAQAEGVATHFGLPLVTLNWLSATAR
ncbi:AlkZ family DNA glycosylase [Candidatus Chloroploca sp. M-50]|uniref:AlkZ family DNA glycosylase n=1 Tax=Candidatus Chloroploca mongolica TaxID=2528176 RepID=A0ABS4D8R2_9CHLR|nr:winged helix DNA-binding domain-containing protein [Candidatus Chloroploca mongolica]MBP1465820.1 AlkZ family DNA glycosylase [Candidatus Chloroploca mongolica]